MAVGLKLLPAGDASPSIVLRFLSVVLLAASVLSAADHPNVVFVMADDLGWGDVSYHGGQARTPQLDAFAERGVQLERYYAYPMCNPTRLALMSGRSATALQARSESRAGGAALPLDVTTMPEVFGRAGYQTFMVGKWHLGSEHVDYFPHRRGWEHFYGFLNAYTDFWTHISNGGLDWQRNGESVREEGYSTILLMDEAVEKLRTRDKSRPTFLYVAFNAVHKPLQAPEAYIDAYADIEDRNQRVYAAMTTAMDDAFGRLWAALESEGMLGETVVVFVSDNGADRTGSNGPLRGFKTQAFEGGIRVPGVVWREGEAEASVSAQFVAVHDWLPTLAEAAGVELKVEGLYGRSVWSEITGGEQTVNDFILGQRGNFAVFEDGWKWVRQGGEESLFQILDDPGESTDRLAEEPERAERLRARLAAFPGADAAGPGRRVRRRAGGRRRAGAGGRRGPNRGGGPTFEPQTEETREPWAESADR